MKSWLYLLTLGLLLSSATLAESLVPSKLAEHHALIGSAGNHVEIYWAVPPPGSVVPSWWPRSSPQEG